MKKNLILILSIVLFVVIMFGAYLLYHHFAGVQKQNLQQPQVHTQKAELQQDTQTDEEDNSQEETEQEQDDLPEAPDFVMYDTEGKQVRLSDFEGKPVVLNFWASWCPPCKGEMPDFEEVFQEQGEEIQFVMVNITDGSRETAQSAAVFIEEQGFTFPVYLDSDLDGTSVYGVSSIPTTYFINADGKIAARAIGAIDKATLEQGLDLIRE